MAKGLYEIIMRFSLCQIGRGSWSAHQLRARRIAASLA
ncbi:MAG: hypothetical protein ACJAUW_002124, partial [Yoonia sp.]